MPDGLHFKEGGNAVNALTALAIKGVRAILHSVWATCDTGDMLCGTLLRLNEKFVGAAPQVIPIDVGMAH